MSHTARAGMAAAQGLAIDGWLLTYMVDTGDAKKMVFTREDGSALSLLVAVDMAVQPTPSPVPDGGIV